MPQHPYKILNRVVSKALHQYQMISDGDRIAVALSGGKDSLTLLSILHEKLRRIKIRYDVVAIHIDPGFEGGYANDLKHYTDQMGYDLHVEYTDYGIVGHSAANRENPCFLCSRLRRKRIFEIANELGCKKIAFAHTKDDIIETLLLNMFYAGEISTMIPSQTFFNGEFTLIRPLAFADESMIQSYAKAYNLPVFTNPCPSAQSSKRTEIRKMLTNLYQTNRKIKGNIFRSLSHVKTEYLLKYS